MGNKSEWQLHKSVQKALTKHFPHVKETTAQQLEAVKALLFTEKGHICCVTYWEWETFTIFQAGFKVTGDSIIIHKLEYY